MSFHQQPFMSLAAVGAALALGLQPAWSQNQNASGPHSLSGGLRYHAEQSVFTDLPYGNGDLSYALAYQYTQGIAIWQLACDVGPDVSGKREVVSGATTNLLGIDYILTPQCNVIIQDRFFRGGGGIRTSYIRDDDGNGEWLNPYGQFQLGLAFPLAKRISIDVAAYYILERWDKILKFNFGDHEYGAWLNFAF